MSLEDDLKGLRVFGGGPNESSTLATYWRDNFLRVYREDNEDKISVVLGELIYRLGYDSSVNGRVDCPVYVIGIGVDFKMGDKAEPVLFYVERFTKLGSCPLLAVPLSDVRRLERLERLEKI